MVLFSGLLNTLEASTTSTSFPFLRLDYLPFTVVAGGVTAFVFSTCIAFDAAVSAFASYLVALLVFGDLVYAEYFLEGCLMMLLLLDFGGGGYSTGSSYGAMRV